MRANTDLCVTGMARRSSASCKYPARQSKSIMQTECCLVAPTIDDYAAVVRRCGDEGVLEAGKSVHEDIIRSGHGRDRYLCNLLIEMYGKCGSLQDALEVFNTMRHLKNVFSWTMIISAYAKLDGNHRDAVQLFQGMLLEGLKPPDSFVYTILLGACANSGWAGLADGKAIHNSCICQVGILHGDVLVETALVNMYGKCGSAQDAELVFRGMKYRNLVSWNAMIVAFADNGLGREALKLFHEMQLQGAKPDSVTFLGLIGASSALREVAVGKAIHRIVVASGIYRWDDVVVGTALVNMYGKCGCLDNARYVFDRMCLRNVVSWNAMISAYAQQGHLREASQLFWEMEVEGMKPDEITFISLLCSCSNLAEGKALQERVIACGFGSELGVANTLLNMYGKLGHLDAAREVFELIQMKDVISWNTMIAAYAQNGHCEQALRIYYTMQLESTRPNGITFVNALEACRNLAEGKQVHNHIVGTMFESNTIVGTALINMYGNCGSLVEARNAFQRLDLNRNVVTWTAMIVAYAQHQHVDSVVELYGGMNLEGLMPNEITFIGILFACGHAGLLDESLDYFHCMIRDHGIEPIPDHYACMGDLLGRTGCLGAVEDLIQNNNTHGFGWTSLLDACRLHGDSERGKRAAQSALELDVRNGATYVLLSNICAAATR